jgi:hypothetical protein
MPGILQSKLAKKAVLLFALIAALAYLRTPTQVQALSCIQQCAEAGSQCKAACDENLECIGACIQAQNECVQNCVP